MRGDEALITHNYPSSPLTLTLTRTLICPPPVALVASSIRGSDVSAVVLGSGNSSTDSGHQRLLLPPAVYEEQARALKWLQAPVRRGAAPTLTFDPGIHPEFGVSAGPEAHRHKMVPIWQLLHVDGSESWVPKLQRTRSELELNLTAWLEYLR